MKKKLFAGAALVITISILSCTAKKEKSPEKVTAAPAFDAQWAKSFIDSVNTKISGDYRKGDSVALAAYYWPDAELLLDNSEPLKGKDLVPVWGGMIRSGIREFTFTTTDIRGGAGYIIETGAYEMKDGLDKLVDRGKYVVVWENRNGEWRLIRDIGNTSLPAVK